jgi:hypothetical protein
MQIFAYSDCVAFDHGQSRELSAQYLDKARLAFDSNDALCRAPGTQKATGQAAGPGAEFEYWPWPLKPHMSCQWRRLCAARSG